MKTTNFRAGQVLYHVGGDGQLYQDTITDVGRKWLWMVSGERVAVSDLQRSYKDFRNLGPAYLTPEEAEQSNGMSTA